MSITDEELAEMETHLQSWLCFEPQHVARLITALRAERAEVERLERALVEVAEIHGLND